MNKKYLSDCIDMERDILPYKRILIISGVGSGKNTWVREQLLMKYKVLFITSRRNIANAELDRAAQRYEEDNGVRARRTINMSKLSEQERRTYWGKAPDSEFNIITTNSYIAHFIENHYDENDERTHLWKYFDFIVVDEVHSLETDATFSDASFHVMKFLFKSSQMTGDAEFPKIIMMTGTPAPIEWMNEGKRAGKVQVINYLQECINRTPRVAYFVPQKYALEEMCREIKKGKKVLYFANHISSIPGIIEYVLREGIDEERIAVSFSDETQMSKFSEIIRRNKLVIEDALRMQEKIPNDIDVLLTTSKNKEGINIYNEDIETVYVESHTYSDMLQMAGRVRAGAKQIVICVDSRGFEYPDMEMRHELERNCLDGANETLGKYQTKEEREKLIALIQHMFEYIRYNYFRQSFEMYNGRYRQRRIQIEEDKLVRTYFSVKTDELEVMWENEKKSRGMV